MANVIDEPRVVEAGRGAAWWAEGWRIFASNFWTWIGIMIVYIIIVVLVSLIPLVGSFGQWLLTPVFMGGLMLGCQAIDRGERLRVAHLFEGFQGVHFVPLMIIGAVNIAITLVLAALAVAGVAGSFSLIGMMQGGAMSDPMGALGDMTRMFTGTGILLTLIGLVIVAVFAMLNWFAPALVVLEGATAVQAMKMSFSSCLRNWVPFLVYGLIGIAIGCAALLLVFGVVLLFGASAILGGGGSNVLSALIGLAFLFMIVMAVFALVLGPIVFGSTYAGYKDTLAVGEAAPVNPAYR
jgi:hypothetical protein